jgi:hypothetical protein
MPKLLQKKKLQKPLRLPLQIKLLKLPLQKKPPKLPQ